MDPKKAKNFESETLPGFFSDLGGYKQTDLEGKSLCFSKKVHILIGISRSSLQFRSFVKNLKTFLRF